MGNIVLTSRFGLSLRVTEGYGAVNGPEILSPGAGRGGARTPWHPSICVHAVNDWGKEAMGDFTRFGDHGSRYHSENRERSSVGSLPGFSGLFTRFIISGEWEGLNE